jgi:uncharacterized protein (UPF0276 family)
MRRQLGVGYRKELASWILSRPRSIDCLELTAEHFYHGRNLRALKEARALYPLVVHGTSLSLGTSGSIHPAMLDEFKKVVELADPLWISEHVSFTRTSAVELGHLTPFRYTEEKLELMIDHARTLSAECGKPLLLENITSHVRIDHEIGEPEFLNRLCQGAGCGLLLDITNLFVNSVNHGFDPYEWLGRVAPAHVKQLHVVGYSETGGTAYDSHAEGIEGDSELLALLDHVLARFQPEMVIIERDENFPASQTLEEDLSVLSRREAHVL